jgi:glycosyltransferase involved in cell wall biosynthesis
MAGEAFAAWFRMPEDMPLLVATLRAIGVARLHFHHVHGLPQSIMDLPRDSGLPYDWTLHDYAPICPQYHLVDERGRYCGEPDAAGCAACIAKRPAQWSLDIGAWRAAFGALLRDAERVIAPSQDVADRVARYFPGLAINVWSHPEGVVAPPRRVIRVVTLGTLSPEKGLEVVAGCAEDARARGLPLTFQVLGATTRPIAQAPAVPLTVHGSYDDRALPEILAGEHADVLFFPAQVPETHSYTLSIALATRTPIVASALGAFGERLAGRAHVRLMPWDATPAQWNTALLEAAAEARAISAASVAPIMAL